MPEQKIKSELRNYSYILLGCVFLSLGIVGFLVPNKIATGGTAGLAIVIHHLFDFPTGVVMALVNVPLLIASFKTLGKRFVIRTIVAIYLTALFIDLWAEFIHIPALSKDPLLATLYGGVAVGLGLGFIFKGDGSAGGGTILAKIISSRTHYKPGFVILVFDALVVISAGLAFKNMELALWSMISIFVTSKLVDLILTGKQHEKVVHISAHNLEMISQKIYEIMGISGTIMNGRDLQDSKGKDLIFIVVEANRISALKNLLKTLDPTALMIVMEASEMLGASRKLNL